MASSLKNKKYSKLNKRQIVLISLYQRGGNKKEVHTEEVAYRAFQINRDEFSWRLEKFKKYPNLQTTIRELSALKTENKVIGKLDSNKNKDGWILTENGLAICNESLKEYLGIKKNKSMPQQYEKSFVISIKRSNYFKFWKKKNITELEKQDIYDVAEFLKVLTSNTPRLIEKFYETKLSSKEIDENVYQFLTFIEDKHNDLFNETKRMETLNKSKKNMRYI